MSNPNQPINKPTHSVFDEVSSFETHFDQNAVRQINSEIKELKPGYKGLVSDGNHTFDELYEHRLSLFCSLAQMIAHNPHHRHHGEIWRARTDDPDWFLAGIGFKAGKQITYHVPMNAWERFWFCSESENRPEWDGHSSADVLARIAQL